jgi:hypothetical protein
MTAQLQQILEQFGIEKCLVDCLCEGISDFQSLYNISESDFAALNVPLGRRRKLQREVARRYLWPDSKPLPAFSELQSHSRDVPGIFQTTSLDSNLDSRLGTLVSGTWQVLTTSH